MKILGFIFAFAFSQVLSASEREEFCLDRFMSCSDLRELSQEADAVLSEISRSVERRLKLAEKSRNRSIGNRERGFLNNDFERLTDHVHTLIQQAQHQDQFKSSWHYLLDGVHVWSPISIKGTEIYQEREMKVDSLSEALQDLDPLHASSILTYELAHKAYDVLKQTQAQINRVRTDFQIVGRVCGEKLAQEDSELERFSGGESCSSRVMSCESAVKLSKAMEQSFAEAMNLLQRQRELAIQASSSSLRARERGFLDDEYQALKDMHGIWIDNQVMVDEFLNEWFYFQEAPRAWVPVHVPGSRLTYKWEMRLPSWKGVLEKHQAYLESDILGLDNAQPARKAIDLLFSHLNQVRAAAFEAQLLCRLGS